MFKKFKKDELSQAEIANVIGGRVGAGCSEGDVEFTSEGDVEFTSEGDVEMC